MKLNETIENINSSDYKNIDKIKVTSVEIIVNENNNKPYYSIKYYKIGDKECYEGFSSYDLNNVLNWVKEYFEIEIID